MVVFDYLHNYLKKKKTENDNITKLSLLVIDVFHHIIMDYVNRGIS